jgi:hypothetical protein
MLSVFTYYADFSVPIDVQPGNIVIRDCQVDYADRFLHYNFSGNEKWQANRPLESIRFENIKATDISMPLTAYGDPDTPITLELKNVELSLREGSEEIALIHVANVRRLAIENLTLPNFRGATLIKTWTDGGDYDLRNIHSDLSEQDYIQKETDVFTCKPI